MMMCSTPHIYTNQTNKSYFKQREEINLMNKNQSDHLQIQSVLSGFSTRLGDELDVLSFPTAQSHPYIWLNTHTFDGCVRVWVGTTTTTAFILNLFSHNFSKSSQLSLAYEKEKKNRRSNEQKLMKIKNKIYIISSASKASAFFSFITINANKLVYYFLTMRILSY